MFKKENMNETWFFLGRRLIFREIKYRMKISKLYSERRALLKKENAP